MIHGRMKKTIPLGVSSMRALRLALTDFLGTREVYQVVCRDNLVNIDYIVDPTTLEGAAENELTGADAAAFIAKLSALDFNTWRKPSAEKSPMLADTRWELTITDDGGQKDRYEGGQPLPENFETLLSLLKYAVTVPGGHFLPATAWQLDYVRFGTIQLPKFDGPGRFLNRQLRYRRTYLIDALNNQVVLKTAYAEPLSDHDVVYHDPELVASLAKKVTDAVAGLGDLTAITVDPAQRPRAILVLTVKYPHGEPTQLQVNAETDLKMKKLWQTVTAAIQNFRRIGERRDLQEAYQLGPQLMHYIKVNFRQGSKDYLYKTDLPGLQEGDVVIVPVGNEGRTLHGEVVDAQVMPPIHFPVHPDKIKQVIGLADWDDEDDDWV